MKVVVLTMKILLLSLVLISCSGKNSSTSVANETSKDADSSLDPLLPNLEHYTNEQEEYVVVLLGYGYNEGEKKDLLLAQLDETYGLIQNGGFIIPFVFPDDFVSFGYERISLLPDNISEILLEKTGNSDISQVSSLIALGSPDATHFALARLQDIYEDIKIFSIFSQDDILGTEAGSTLVIDYSISQTEQREGYETLGEIDLSYPGDIFVVVSPLINAGLDWERVTKSGLLVPALRTEYAKKTNCNFYVYIDPQTGIRSENHYVLTAKENAEAGA